MIRGWQTISGKKQSINGYLKEMYRRTLHSLIRPKIFFSDIKSERGLKNPFVFLVIVMSLTFIFLTYQHIILFNSLMAGLVKAYNSIGFSVRFPEIKITFWTYAITYLVLVVSFILVSFLWYYITHLCIRMMGGKHSYDQTYKAMTYSLSADYLSLPAFIVSMVSLGNIILNRGIISIVIFIVSTILYLIPTVYRLYLRLIGIERLQEISKFRAFIAAYVLAYVFVFLALLVIDAVILAVIYLLITLFGLSLPF